jgi:hypothetical protein
MKQRAPVLFLALIVIAAMVAARPFAQTAASDVVQPSRGAPEVIAATFSSAFCPACAVLKPKLARVLPRFADKPIAFVEFDYTIADRKALRAKAEALGIAPIYEAAAGATGYTVLIDAQSGLVLDTLTQNFSEKALEAALARALDIAAYTDDQPAVTE